METGIRVPGPMEIRSAWFYNELKPRLYFTNGGDSYFRSLFIADLSNRVCEFLPSTNPVSRFFVERCGSVRDDEVLITYDYTSFTSSLSELKYFLFYLGLSLHGIPAEIYDPYEGIVTADLGDIIRDYNDFANHYCLFSVERFDKLLEHPIFSLNQNGGLGIKGNITLSTALHGLSLADITGRPDNDCCVGDDALSIILHSFFHLFVSCVNNLGSINEDKFQVIQPILHDPLRRSSFKFLKRPLDLDSQNIPTLGSLDFFPDFATLLFPEGDSYHTPSLSSYEDNVHSFISQTSRYIKLAMRRRVDITPEDSIFLDDDLQILKLFRSVYKTVGLPEEGSLPGYRVLNPILKSHFSVHLFIPPIDTEVVLEIGWVELLFTRYSGDLFEAPCLVGTIVPPESHYVGQEAYVSSNIKEITLLTDLGYLSRERVVETVSFTQRYAERLNMNERFDDRTQFVLYRYTVKRVCPHYNDLMKRFHTIDNGQDVLEELATVASVFTEND
jgi:hypothetical protein